MTNQLTRVGARDAYASKKYTALLSLIISSFLESNDLTGSNGEHSFRIQRRPQAIMNLSEPSYVEPAFVGTVRLANIFIILAKSHISPLSLPYFPHYHLIFALLSFHICLIFVSIFPNSFSRWSGGPLRGFSFQLSAVLDFLVNM